MISFFSKKRLKQDVKWLQEQICLVKNILNKEYRERVGALKGKTRRPRKFALEIDRRFLSSMQRSTLIRPFIKLLLPKLLVM